MYYVTTGPPITSFPSTFHCNIDKMPLGTSHNLPMVKLVLL